jgi:hypothetical protein
MNMRQNDTLLNVSGKNYIRDVQLAFNKAYPFLKIEFYKEPPPLKSGHKKYLEGSLPLTAAGLTTAGGMIISDSMTVYQLESELKNNFGLKAHAFRKSGSMWLEITMTGDWTLKHQNQHGQELSESTKIEPFKDKEAPDNSLE